MLVFFLILSCKVLKHSSYVAIHSSDVVICGIHIRVVSVSHGFDVIVDVV